MQRLVLTVDGKVRYLRPPIAPSVLGTGADCDLVLHARGISRRHARYLPGEPNPQLIDLGSKNGIVVDGRRVESVELAPGQDVRLGAAWLRLEEISTADGELAIELSGPIPAPRVSSYRDSETIAQFSDTAPGPAAALRLVRELQEVGEASGEATREALARTRQILGASSLFTFALPENDVALAACAGPLPPPAVLDGLPPPATSVPAMAPAVARSRLDGKAGTLLVVEGPRDSPARLAAHFGAPAEPAPWQEELLLWLASHLAIPAPLMEPRSPPPSGALRFPVGTVLGTSAPMRELLAAIRATLSSGLDVLLTGDTGTGKEHFAKMIHLSGPKPDGPFVPVNCPGIPENLQEAEFFGIGRNVASGVDRRPGYFQHADGGTLFLDEIGDMPPPLQAKLLRVLQEREYLPVGSSRPRRVEVRIVASTNSNLPAAVVQGRFREDLYYRLRQLEYHIPTLAVRRRDIPELALEFARQAAEVSGKKVLGVSRHALDLLLAHEWPGNIRELKHTIAHAVASCPNGGAIESDHLGRHLRCVDGGYASGTGSQPTTALPSSPPENLDRIAGSKRGDGSAAAHRTSHSSLPTLDLEALERRAIKLALLQAGGNKSEAARLLGVSRAGLYKKIERLGAKN